MNHCKWCQREMMEWVVINGYATCEWCRPSKGEEIAELKEECGKACEALMICQKGRSRDYDDIIALGEKLKIAEEKLESACRKWEVCIGTFRFAGDYGVLVENMENELKKIRSEDDPKGG